MKISSDSRIVQVWIEWFEVVVEDLDDKIVRC